MVWMNDYRTSHSGELAPNGQRDIKLYYLVAGSFTSTEMNSIPERLKSRGIGSLKPGPRIFI